MCGFIGFTNNSLHDNLEQIVDEMANAIRHRGPDSGGKYIDPLISMGFRRLKIIDLSSQGDQPMLNNDGSCVLVFNGEIYNYQELRETLIARGHRFKSETDSEVVLHGYEEYGTAILRKLRGMFSLAIWDSNNHSIFMARDFFGIKPLYYTQHTQDHSLVFSSEIKAILKHPLYIKEFNENALRPYLSFQYSALDETFFKGVYKLPPAHYMLYKNGKMTIRPYWEARFNQTDRFLKYYTNIISETLEASVNCHKISDVNVGSFLSGGIDSSYITSLLLPNESFSVGFSRGDFDETAQAAQLSDMLGIENHSKIISPGECFSIMPKIQYYMDEPAANPSCVPLYFLCQLASEHVTVVLSGEGADELFGGYLWYLTSRKMRAYKKLPFFIRRRIHNTVKSLPQNRITDFLYRGGQKVEERFIGQAYIFQEKEAFDILNEKYRRGPTPSQVTQRFYDKVQGQDDLTKMQFLDINLWLPGDILLKADKMSMAHSIELRVPFLDKQVMKIAEKIPSRYRVRNMNTKYALRAAAKTKLPKAWSNRPKVGFPVPIRYWFREDRYYQMICGLFTGDEARQFFNTKALLKLARDHYESKADNGRKLWTIYTFLVWYRQFFSI